MRGVERGIYTVTDDRPEPPRGSCGWGQGLPAPGQGDAFAAVMNAEVPRPDLSDSKAEDEGELVERLGEHGSNGGSSRSLRTVGRSSRIPTCRRSGVATRPRGHHVAVAGFQRHEGRPYTLAHHVRRDRPDELSAAELGNAAAGPSTPSPSTAWTTRASAACRPDAAGGDRRGDRPDDGAAPCASPTRTTARRRRTVQHRQLAHRRRL
jgi:hypothetical protein